MPLFKLGSGSGAVTSVALTAPSIFSVSGSPITTAGTLAIALVTQAANLVWAGPASGAAANPTFRSLVAADIPDLSSIYQPLNANLTAFSALANAAGALTNNGSGVLSWVAPTGPAGADTEIQYNEAGAFGASAGLVWDRTLSMLRVGVSGLTPVTPSLTKQFYGGPAGDVIAEFSGNVSGAGLGVYHLLWANRGVSAGGQYIAGISGSSGGSDANTGQIALGVKRSPSDTFLTSVLHMTNGGSLVVGADSALATNATDGFLYIGGGAGTPTGTPTAFLGKYPLYWDSTADRLWAYNSAWIGVGTVTSVGLTVPSFLSVSGSPVTTSGTLALTLATQTANTVFAGPTTGAAAAPTFRALVAADFSSIPATTFTMATARLLGRTTAGTGAVEEITVGTGLTLSGGSLSNSGGSGTVNSGTATQVAYYASTGTAVSSSPQFTVGASGNPAVTASGTNQGINLSPSGSGFVSVLSGHTGGAGLAVKNTSTGIPTLELWTGGSNKNFLASVVSTDSIITGSASGDFCMRSVGGNILFSADNGVSAGLKIITSTNLIRLPKYTTAGLLSNDTSGNVTTATAGTSLSLSGGVLNTIQGIRTTDSPTFASLTLNNTATAPATLDLSGTQSGAVNYRIANVITGVSNTGWSLRDVTNSINVLTSDGTVDANVSTGVTDSSRFTVRGVVKVFIPSGGGGVTLDASTGTANTGMNITWQRGGSSKWNLGTGITLGSDAFELYDRANSVSAFSIAASTSVAIFAGNVGLGGTPSTKLHVFGVIRQTNATNTSGFDIGLLNGSGDATAYVYNRANAGLVFGTNNATAVQIDTSGNLQAVGSLKTGNPSGGTAQPFKHGSYVGGAPAATGYVQVEINGTAFKLLAST